MSKIGYIRVIQVLEVLRSVSVPDEDAHESPLRSCWTVFVIVVVVVVVPERTSKLHGEIVEEEENDPLWRGSRKKL